MRGGSREAVDGRRRLHLRGSAALALGLGGSALAGRVQNGMDAQGARGAALGARRGGLRGGRVNWRQGRAAALRRLIPGATRQALHCGGRAGWGGVGARGGGPAGELVEERGRRT